MVFRRALVAGMFGAFLALQAAAFELVMIEQEGCHYCRQWDAVIGPIYPKTAEGTYAPLRRVDLHKPMPKDLSFEARVVFTPTFILVEDGVERARIEGYPGEELFWWLLGKLLKDNTDFQGGPS